MNAFDRAARAGVVFGVALALVAAASARSAPAPSPGLSHLPREVVRLLDPQLDLIGVEIVHDEDHFMAWTSDRGVQLCATLVVSASAPVRESSVDQLEMGQTCGPPGVRPSDSLYLTRTVAVPEAGFGVVVVLLPDDYAATEWDVEAEPQPTRTVRGPHSFALVYRGDDWQGALHGVGVEVACRCGGFLAELGFGDPSS